MKTPIIFDNDCISSFLWVNRVDIIKTVFPKQIIVPTVVCNEIKKVNYIYGILDGEVRKKEIEIVDLEINSEAFNEYIKLISPKNQMQIDPGEAAAIVLAKKLNGTLASNNLKDILPYVKTEEPPYICTDSILYASLKQGIITEEEGTSIWIEMKKRKRALPKYDFLESVRRFDEKLPR
jgi:hypothetical protein